MLSSVFESTQAWAKKCDIPCEAHREIGSTNTRAKEQAFTTFDPLCLILADRQTAGRGRGDHNWVDPGPGQSLAISFCYQPDRPPGLILTPLVGLALYGAASLAFPALAFSLKPPNDLFLEDRKLAGVLVEVVARGGRHALVIGVGLNVLAAPPLASATYLCGPDGLDGPCDEVAWFEFLTRFRTLMDRFLPYAARGRLPPIERAALLGALNAFPHKATEYLNLTDEAELVTDAGSLSWRNF